MAKSSIFGEARRVLVLKRPKTRELFHQRGTKKVAFLEFYFRLRIRKEVPPRTHEANSHFEFCDTENRHFYIWRINIFWPQKSKRIFCTKPINRKFVYLFFEKPDFWSRWKIREILIKCFVFLWPKYAPKSHISIYKHRVTFRDQGALMRGSP